MLYYNHIDRHDLVVLYIAVLYIDKIRTYYFNYCNNSKYHIISYIIMAACNTYDSYKYQSLN